MSKLANFSIRTDTKTKKLLDKIAKSQERSVNFVVNEAIDSYLDYWDWSVDHIKKGLEEAKRGKGSPHDEVFSKLERKLKKRLANQ